MARKTAKQKGDALEHAVATIERSILRPVDNATMECKKVIKVAGVTHEIDLFVMIDVAPHYRSVFIFECKNWAVPVGKNEIVVFSEKINVSNAARGFFVAQRFTADAKAQADKDKRITLLTVDEHDPLLLAPHYASRGYETTFAGVRFNITAFDGSRLFNAPQTTPVSIWGIQTVTATLLYVWAHEALKKASTLLTNEKEPGEHCLAFPFEHNFAEGEMEVLGKNVRNVVGVGLFNVFVAPQQIAYSFDIKPRGKVISFTPARLPGNVEMRSNFIVRYKEDAAR